MIKKIIYFPFYVASIFTTTKNFRDNYVIGSPLLNLLGLHVARIIFAHVIWKIRQLQLAFLLPYSERKFYNDNGYLLKENFLDNELFEKIVHDVRNYHGDARQGIQGDTITWRVFLDDRKLAILPALKALIRHPSLQALVKYTSAKNSEPYFYIQQIRNGKVEVGDPQKVLHSDTFHPTMKAWFFLEDVHPEKGPFTYVPCSHNLSLPRLKWEYRKSISAAHAEIYSAKGSFRIDRDELRSLGLSQPKSFAVAKNTLVIANTNGFHARGAVESENMTRLEIWASSRTNPFNPWVGIDISLLRKLNHSLHEWYLEYQDYKAAKRHSQPSWPKVIGGVI